MHWEAGAVVMHWEAGVVVMHWEAGVVVILGGPGLSSFWEAGVVVIPGGRGCRHALGGRGWRQHARSSHAAAPLSNAALTSS